MQGREDALAVSLYIFDGTSAGCNIETDIDESFLSTGKRWKQTLSIRLGHCQIGVLVVSPALIDALGAAILCLFAEQSPQENWCWLWVEMPGDLHNFI